MSQKYKPIGKSVTCQIHAMAETLNDVAKLQSLVWTAAIEGGLTPLQITGYKFNPQGASIMCILAESHISIHTYPEDNTCFVDVFTCGGHNPMKCLNHLNNKIGGIMVDLLKTERGSVEN